MTSPFLEAKAIADNIREMIDGQLTKHMGSVDEFRQRAESSMDALLDGAAGLNFSTRNDAGVSNGYVGESMGKPTKPGIAADIDIAVDLGDVNVSDFGGFRGENASYVDPGPVREMVDVAIPEFTPSPVSLNIPDAPAQANHGPVPQAPTLTPIDLPVMGAIDDVPFPSLAAITIPDFTFPTLHVWDTTAPEFQGTPVSTVLQWGDPQYATEVLPEVLTHLRAIWAGGNGIDPAIEAALWERAAGREDLDANRQISAATIEFSSRGFTMPPGMQVARIDAIREESQIKKQGVSRDTAIRMAEVHVQNFRFAVEQAVACENTLFNIWNNIAARQFDAAKIQIDSQMAMYNAQVALFNARQSAYATEAQVFKIQVEADLAELKIMEMQLQAELARGQLNEQNVRIYSERVKAAHAVVEVFKARMQGAAIQADVQKTEIESFRVSVQAFAEVIGADKVRFDAYKAQLEGEMAKAGLLEVEARAYAAQVTGVSKRIDAEVAKVQSDISRQEAAIRRYVAEIERDKARAQSDLARIQAITAAYGAQIDKAKLELSIEETKGRLEIMTKEGDIRVQLANYETEIRRYIADMEQLVRKASVQVEALRAAGQLGSTLAAGAMAAVNLSAGMSASGSVSASGTVNVNE